MTLLNSLQPVPVPVPAFSTPSPVPQHPRFTSSTLLTASPADLSSLQEIHSLLTSLFIRNRNQHRRNHWFKSLQQFRKQLELLLQELDVATGAAVPEKGSKKKGRKEEEKLKKEAGERLEARLRYWDQKCIHQWYLHFTQLVACGPFAVLGLVLMACTARVCRITGITALYEEIGSEDMRAALRMIDQGVGEEEISAMFGAEGDVEMGIGEEDGEDLGEVVPR